MKKQLLEPTLSTFPMPVVLIGTIVNNKPNFINVAWVNIACRKPVSIVAAINHSRHSLKGIQENKTFSVNMPSADLLKKTDFCGIYSGRNTDKSTLFDLHYGDSKTAPLIEACPLNLECKLTNSLDIGTHILVIGEVMHTYAAENILNDNNEIDPAKINPILYVPAGPAGEYYALGQQIGHAFHDGKELP